MPQKQFPKKKKAEKITENKSVCVLQWLTKLSIHNESSNGAVINLYIMYTKAIIYWPICKC